MWITLRFEHLGQVVPNHKARFTIIIILQQDAIKIECCHFMWEHHMTNMGYLTRDESHLQWFQCTRDRPITFPRLLKNLKWLFHLHHNYHNQD